MEENKNTYYLKILIDAYENPELTFKHINRFALEKLCEVGLMVKEADFSFKLTDKGRTVVEDYIKTINNYVEGMDSGHLWGKEQMEKLTKDQPEPEYILNIRLPFADKGTKVIFLNSSNNSQFSYTTLGYDVIAGYVRFWINSDADKNNIISSGWVKKIRPKVSSILRGEPREFFITYNPSTQELQGYVSSSLPKIQKYSKPDDEIIKVREIIEEEKLGLSNIWEIIGRQ